MPMNEECKHYQSRTYPSGEVARFCVLDLAPEAPWSCPDNCQSYERRLADVGWVHGSLIEPPLEDAPVVPPGNARDILDEAEDIVNAIVPEAKREAEQLHNGEPPSLWRRIFRRPPDTGSTKS